MKRSRERALLSCAIFVASLSIFSAVSFAQQFTNVSTEAGIIAKRTRTWGNPLWGDLNNDGWLDLIVPKHELVESGAQGNGPPPFVYINNGDGTFTDARKTSGFQKESKDDGAWQGFALGDYNGDGYLDVFIVEPPYLKGFEQATRDLLYQGVGNGTFEYVSSSAGIGLHKGQGEAAFFVDYDNDGKLDLFVKNIPNLHGVGVNMLYHNNGDGTFSVVPNAGGLADAEHGKVEGSVCSFADYDNDGFMDVAFCGNGASEALYRNNGDGTFTDVTVAAGLTPHANATSLAWGDYNNDGFLDLFVSRGDPQGKGRLGCTLYRNNGDGTFTDVTAEAGLNTNTNLWAAVWGDYDNDGYLDLFVARPGTTTLGVGNANLLYHNNGDGTFTDVAATEGVALEDDSPTSAHKVAAWGDYNNDGFLDLVIKDGIGPTEETGDSADGYHYLFKNNGGTNHFLKVNLQGVQSNLNGIGARVTVKANGRLVFRENNGGGGGELSSQGSGPLHFGIAKANFVTVIVHWPSGIVDTLQRVAANSTITIVEGSSP